MISSEDRAKIIEIAKKYHAKRILLFGSHASRDHEGRDIDLAVKVSELVIFSAFVAT